MHDLIDKIHMERSLTY